MKTVLVVLGIVVAIGLAAPVGLQVEASVNSIEFDAFVRAGSVALTGISFKEAVSVANGAGWEEKKEIFTVTCNDEPFNGTECIGQTIVNTTYVNSDDDIVYVVRYCNGKFTNQTWHEMDANDDIDTSQMCKGKTFSYIKNMIKRKSTGEWHKAYFYSKSCFSKYYLCVKTLPTSLVGVQTIKVSTYCETASETVEFVEEDECGPDKKSYVDAQATCNCEATTMDQPCEGRFKFVMHKKPSSIYGRKLTESSGNSEEHKDEKWTFICDGKWVPYGNAFYECEGIKQEYKERERFDYHNSKNCTGIFGVSMFKEKSDGYAMCNGMSNGEETLSIPIYTTTI